MQVPGFGAEHCAKLKELHPDMTLYQYASLQQEERKEIFYKIFGKEASQLVFEEQERCVSSLPIVKLEMSMIVEGEEDIVVGDILSCKVKVTFPRLKKGEQSGYVHSLSYPYLRRDRWYLVITDAAMQGIAACEKLPIEDNIYEQKYTERIYRPGPIAFLAVLANDSYKGLDVQLKASTVVYERSSTRKEHKYQKVDKWLCEDKATFFKRQAYDYDTDDENE